MNTSYLLRQQRKSGLCCSAGRSAAMLLQSRLSLSNGTSRGGRDRLRKVVNSASRRSRFLYGILLVVAFVFICIAENAFIQYLEPVSSSTGTSCNRKLRSSEVKAALAELDQEKSPDMESPDTDSEADATSEKKNLDENSKPDDVPDKPAEEKIPDEKPKLEPPNKKVESPPKEVQSQNVEKTASEAKTPDEKAEPKAPDQTSPEKVESNVAVSSPPWESFGCGKSHPILSCQKSRVRSLLDQFRVPNENDFKRLVALRQRHAKCAIVDAVDKVAAKIHGAEIDAADVVVRVNEAMSTGDGRVRGKRVADVVIANSRVSRCPTLSRDSSVLVLRVGEPTDVDKVFVMDCHNRYRTKTFYVSSEVKKAASTVSLQYQSKLHLKAESDVPTTGLIAVAWALPLCDEVHFYGFGFDGPDGKFTYFSEDVNSDKLKPFQLVDYDVEHAVLKEMAKGKFVDEIKDLPSSKTYGKVIVHE